MGRQPWSVFGLLPHRRRRLAAVGVASVLTSLIVFTLLYGVLAVVDGVLMVRYAKAGPPPPTPLTPVGRRRARPRAHGLRVLKETTMALTDIWFLLIAVLWTGYFVLEGFDFGVGMLLPLVGRDRDRPPRRDQHHRPGLGRQRGLAARRGRRDLRRVPRVVRDACSPASTSRCCSSSSR